MRRCSLAALPCGCRSANGNDGPKWTCGVQLLKQPCVLFSLGSNNVIDFESEMYKWGRCTIHVFDPTVSGDVAPALKQQVVQAAQHVRSLRAVAATAGTGASCAPPHPPRPSQADATLHLLGLGTPGQVGSQ